jgi:hypothetical protein
MGRLIKSIVAIKPEQLLKVEAGPISILMGANLRKQETKTNSKSSDQTKETKNG